MPSNVFTPEVGQISSAVTPTEGVSKSGDVGIFADVASTAVAGGFEVAGHMELNDLSRKFKTIAQARKTGNRDLLMGQARGALNKAKAESPWIASQADALFRESFGGGGSGAFAKTPEEEARDKYLKDVHEYALRLGVEPVEAQKYMAADEDLKRKVQRAESQKYQQNVDGGVIIGALNAELVRTGMSVINQVQDLSSKGSLGIKEQQSLKMGLQQAKLKMLADLNSRSTDPKTKHLMVTIDTYNEGVKAIENWVKTQEKIIDDNSYAELISKVNTAKRAEISYVAANKYEAIMVANAAGGQSQVEALLKLINSPEGTYKELVKKFNPVASDLYKREGDFLEAVGGGVDKLLLGKGKPVNLTQAESLAVGAVIVDPKNAATKDLILTEAGKNPDKADKLEQVIVQSPDTSKVAYGEDYKRWRQANKEEANSVSETVLEGLRKSFASSYVLANKNANMSFSYQSDPAYKGMSEEQLARSRGISASKRRVIKGEGITPEMATVIENARKVIESNPDLHAKINERAGMALSTELAVRYEFTGELPEIEEPQEPTKKTLEGEEPKKKVGQDPAKKVETLDDEDDG